MADLKVNFKYGSKARFDALSTKDPDTLYFVEGVLYKGADVYGGAFTVVSSYPATGNQGVLYINSTDGSVSFWNGTSYNTVVPPIVKNIDGSVTDEQLATAKALKDYVDTQIEGVTGGSSIISDIESKSGSNGTLEITKGDGSTADIALTGVAHDPTFDSTNLRLTIPVVGGSPLIVNIPKDVYLVDGQYNTSTKNIDLEMNNGTVIEVPAASLVDVYTSGSGTNDTVSITVTDDNKISATFKVDTSGALGIANDGRLTVDLSSYATVARVAAVESNVATLMGSATTNGSVAKALADAKAYADTVSANALNTAKAYTDSALTWAEI